MKLTNYYREQILSKYMKETIQPKMDRMLEKLYAASEACYWELVGQSFLRCAEKNPDWFESATGVIVADAGRKRMLAFKESVPVPNYATHYNHAYDSATAPKTYATFNTLYDACQEARRKRDEIRKDIESSLLSVNTLKQLLEIWPEAGEYIDVNTCTAIAKPMDDIKARVEAFPKEQK